MPAMPRQNIKATRIAFNIIGVPANLRAKRTRKQKEVDRQLMRQETSRVR